MAASAADVRSVLSLPQPQLASKPAPAPRKSHKPEGISREVYALIGPSTPSIAAQISLAAPQLKQKPNLGGGGKVKWQWRSFTNGTRSDKLQLHHWVKAKSEYNPEYPFAKYNVPLNTYTYTQEEYDIISQEDKDNWTKEETDYLFALIKEYDLRWYIVHDRYDFPGGEPRALEDLKDHYCSICRRLIRIRPGEEDKKLALQSIFTFDKERELTRKMYVLSLEGRTPEQIANEEALYIQLKRLEQNERRFKREREDLLRITAGIEAGLADVVEDEVPASLGTSISSIPPTTSASTVDTKRKRIGRGASMIDDGPSTPTNTISLTPTAPKFPMLPKSGNDAKHCIVRTDPNLSSTKGHSIAACLRSSRLPVPKQPLAPKITQTLTELGISHTRLVMPTRENCLQLEALLDATTALVETKRVADRIEMELQVAQERLRMKESGQTSGQHVGNVEDLFGDNEELDGEDLDGDGEADDSRAQSVMSTRSTRSRKHTRRSASVSSVDTSATAPRKRQKRG